MFCFKVDDYNFKMAKMTRQMKMKTVESLVCMVKSVENQFTTIDLQNESSVYGLVKEVDWSVFYCINNFRFIIKN